MVSFVCTSLSSSNCLFFQVWCCYKALEEKILVVTRDWLDVDEEVFEADKRVI